MTTINGKDGGVKFGANLAWIQSWNLAITNAVKSVTAKGQSWEASKPGFNDFTGGCELAAYEELTPITDFLGEKLELQLIFENTGGFEGSPLEGLVYATEGAHTPETPATLYNPKDAGATFGETFMPGFRGWGINLGCSTEKRTGKDAAAGVVEWEQRAAGFKNGTSEITCALNEAPTLLIGASDTLVLNRGDNQGGYTGTAIIQDISIDDSKDDPTITYQFKYDGEVTELAA